MDTSSSTLSNSGCGLLHSPRMEELEPKYIKKDKGFLANNASYSDYENMYLHSKSMQEEKISSITNYSKGSVTIKPSKITINWNSYKKRDKIYNPETNLWIDTRPLYINTLI